MTLDEAIKHAEEVAIEEVKLCKRYDDASGYTRSHNEEIRTSDAKRCEKCADEHRQLAEWLKDYKRLLEQESFMNKPCVAHQVCHEDKVKVLDKIRVEITAKIGEEEFARSVFRHEEKDAVKAEQCTGSIMAYNNVIKIIDKYRESEG